MELQASRAIEEMKAQMQSIRFETFVSHKLLTPLTGLIGCLQIVVDDLPPEMNPATSTTMSRETPKPCRRRRDWQ